MYIFHFAANSTVDAGQTIPVDVYDPASTSSTTGTLGI